MLIAVLKNSFTVLFIITFGTLSFPVAYATVQLKMASNMALAVLHRHGGPKKLRTKLMAVILSNLNRFSKFFHRNILE